MRLLISLNLLSVAISINSFSTEPIIKWRCIDCSDSNRDYFKASEITSNHLDANESSPMYFTAGMSKHEILTEYDNLKMKYLGKEVTEHKLRNEISRLSELMSYKRAIQKWNKNDTLSQQRKYLTKSI